MPCISHLGDVLPPLFVGIYSYGAKSERKFPMKYANLMNQTVPDTLRSFSTGVNNEDIFCEYILKVVKPWKTARNLNPVLILGEATCHLTPKVEKGLKEAMTLPVVLPGGSTSLLQPLDVQFNKLMKGMIRKWYTDWLEKKAKIIQGNMDAPELLKVIDWAINSMSSFSQDQIFKAFTSTGISKELSELRDADLWHLRLDALIGEYLIKTQNERELLDDDDDEDFYADNVDRELQRLSFEQELWIDAM